MAYGQFVDYTALPQPDAFAFQRVNGAPPLTLIGQPALDLKRRLDAYKAAQPDLRVAGPGGGEENMSQPEPQMSVAPPPEPPPPAPAPAPEPPPPASDNMSVPEPNMSVAPAAPAAPAAAPKAPGKPVDPMLRNINGKLYEWTHNKDGKPQYTRVLGSNEAGVRQYDERDTFEERKATAGSKGGFIERSRTVQGGQPIDPELEAQRLGNYEKQVEAHQLGVEAAMEDAAATRGFLQQQQAEAAREEAEAVARAKEIETRVGNLRSKYDAQEAAYQSSKVNQNKILEGGAGVIMGLAAGLGAFGAALARTPNYALDTINQMIDRSVRQQEAERAVKGEGARNTLRDLERELGSLDLAKTALRALKTNAAKLQFESIAATTNDAKIKANALAGAAALEKQELERKEQLMRDATGLVTRAFVNVPGSAGSPGGLTRPERGAAPGLSEQPKADPNAKKSEKEANVDGAIASIDSSIASLDEYKDEDTVWTPEGENIGRRTVRDIANKIGGEGTYEANAIPEEVRERSAAVQQAQNDGLAAMSVMHGQGALADDEYERQAGAVRAARKVGDVRKALLRAREKAANIRRGVVAPK
jgi:hypothetical protein